MRFPKSGLLKLSLLLSAGRVAGAETIVLGGPFPDGWKTVHNVDEAANLAIDMGWMYEYKSPMDRKQLWTEGPRNTNSELTLSGLGIGSPRNSTLQPLKNYYINFFDAAGRYFGNEPGTFDKQEVELYPNTLIEDLFEVDEVAEPVPGIEKEGILIFAVWMRVYEILYTGLILACREGGDDMQQTMELGLDMAAALWIGRLQINGDNARGTMLYNLAERAAINFDQDHGESEVNKKFLTKLKAVRQIVANTDGQCDGGYVEYSAKSNTETDTMYYRLYEALIDLIGVMNVPLIQNLIHYIVTEADGKLIEMYMLALLPQLSSCNPKYLEYTLDIIAKIPSKEYTNDELMEFIGHVQDMYSCLGTTCEDVGIHTGDLGCEDLLLDRIRPLAGYKPVYDVRSFSRIDRDVNQIAILIEEGNIDAAKELYWMGRNVLLDGKLFSLRDFADSSDFKDISKDDDDTRIYVMYENFYGIDNYAVKLMDDGFQMDDNYDPDLMAKYYLPTLMKALIIPQYAMRAFFAAYDVCDDSPTRAQEFWDRGTATLVGSIASEESNIVGNGEGGTRGTSWYALNLEYCRHFNCGDKDFVDPTPNRKMMDHIQSGFQAITRSDCNVLLHLVREMESILLVPILQGMLYHSALREQMQDNYHYGASVAFARAIVPILSIRDWDDATMIGDSLLKNGKFTEASQVWSTSLLSLADLGIDCKDLGEDTMGILSATATSFCEHFDDITPAPTPSPTQSHPAVPPSTPRPTKSTPSPTRSDIPALIIQTESIPQDYTFTDIKNATMKARIALDLKEIITPRNDATVNQVGGDFTIYSQGKHSDRTIKDISLKMDIEMDQDIHFNLYRHVFKNDPLFLKLGDTKYADEYAHKIIVDAFSVGAQVELAYEAIVVLSMWMEVVHLLESAARECGKEASGDTHQAALHIDDALAYYVGVGQSKGETDGFLLYSFAQKSATAFGTIDKATGEAKVNKEIMNLFMDAKNTALTCSGGEAVTKSLRSIVGVMISRLNVPLVQSFYQTLQIGAKTDKASFYATLYGLAALPQIATCQPTEYQYLSSEITENGLDVANVQKLMKSLNSTFSCYGITCADVHGGSEDCGEIQNSYAGFQPIEDVRKDAIIDRDMLKIEALILEEALQAAEEYYTYGFHLALPPPGMQLTSLRDLANDPILQQNSFFEAMKFYHGTSNFADDIILNAIRGLGEFVGTSIRQRRDAVMTALQALVLLPAAIGNMYKATSCEYLFWDKGASYLIGSIEGAEWGGDAKNSGVSMYHLAKELCQSFFVCALGKNALSNDKLLDFFSAGEELISGGTCGDLTEYMDKNIVPLLLGSLIQGVIDYSENDSLRGKAYVLQQAIVPFVAQATNNDTIANIIIDNTSLDNVGSMISVLNAFAGVIEPMGLDCLDISKDLCPQGLNSTETTDLSDGLYITTTYVQNKAEIDLDIEFIREQLQNGNIQAARDVYNKGWSSKIMNENGKQVGLRSVASLSLESSSVMGQDPVYNLYRHALRDVFLNGDVDTYADNIVQKYLKDTFFESNHAKHDLVAAEAAVALNIWSQVVHKLYEALDKCIADDSSKGGGVHSIDEAVAFYIGSTQTTGSHSQGHLLYRLAEDGSKMFDVEMLGGQSRANRKVVKYFKEAAFQLSVSGACSQSDFTISSLGVTIQKLVSQMIVPLIQHLIFFLKTGDRQRVEVYSYAVIPLISPCSPAAYEYLKKNLITELPYDALDVDDIIKALQSTYNCLGLTCNDIGKPLNIDVPSCESRGGTLRMAGYSTTTDVREYSDLDIDIRYISIMMGMNATSAANFVYKFGKHSTVPKITQRELLSLRDLAVSVGRKKIPSFSIFEKYHSNNPNYADEMIETYIMTPDNRASTDQVQTLVANTLKYQILYFASLEKMYEAAEGCSSPNHIRYNRAREEWDAAAAMIIGPTDDSKASGYLLYSLGTNCKKFGTCDARSGESIMSEKIEEGFYAGSYLLETQACSGLQSLALKLEGYMKVLLFQATLLSALDNDGLSKGTQDSSLAKGHVFSHAIVPYISNVDGDAAKKISRNLAFNLDIIPVEDGHNEVFREFKNVINEMSDMNCKDIGVLHGKSFCESSTSTSDASNFAFCSWMVICATIVIGLI